MHTYISIGRSATFLEAPWYFLLVLLVLLVLLLAAVPFSVCSENSNIFVCCRCCCQSMLLRCITACTAALLYVSGCGSILVLGNGTAPWTCLGLAGLFGPKLILVRLKL